MHVFKIFITAVCFTFLIKLRWPKSKLEANKDYHEKTCRPEEDMCIRVWEDVDSLDEEWVGKWVYNICGTQETCDDEKSHCKTQKSKKVCKVACCYTDFCNTGSSVTYSGFLLTVSFVLGLALLK